MSVTNQDLKAVPLKNFISGRVSNAEVYLKLSKDKYVKIVNSGESYDQEQIKRFTDNKITHLYVKKEEYQAHVRDIVDLGEAVGKTKNLPDKVKLKVFTQTAEAVISDLHDMGFDSDTFIHASRVTKTVSQNLAKHMDISKILTELSQISEDQVRHYVGVSMIANMLAVHMGWVGGKTLDIICTGGLLHDVGLKDLPPALLLKHRSEMTPAEVSQYLAHPEVGKDILTGMKDVPEEVAKIAYDHHELPSGAGFPRSLKRAKIFPLARVVSLADRLCHDILVTGVNAKPKPLDIAANKLKSSAQVDFDTEHWEALEKIVGQSKKKAS